MTNSNCLEGIACPACGNEDRLRIAGTTVFTVTDEGTEDHGDILWDDDSYARCPECDREGVLRDFRAKPSRLPPDPAPYFRDSSLNATVGCTGCNPFWS